MMSNVAADLIAWQKVHGRHDLPWQAGHDAYAIWISEIMLQQTQVATVIPYYRRFMTRFPDVRSLASATLDEVLELWSGLGYYARARNLHRAARLVCERHGGRFPLVLGEVLELPGVGPSTAAAIVVFATGSRHAILDGNVKRVLTRCLGISGYPGSRQVAEQLWQAAESLLPQKEIKAYTQGLMDLGAAICVRRAPRCGQCPLCRHCLAYRDDRVSELPTPRPRKPLPERAATLLILMREGEVLLEQRPASGIWGGLWSFPELAATQELVQACVQRYGARVTRSSVELPPFEHVFTHFRLAITPRVLRVLSVEPRVAELACRWFTLERARHAAVPAPVRRLLDALVVCCGQHRSNSRKSR